MTAFASVVLVMAKPSAVPVTFEASYQAHRQTIFRLCLRYGGGRVGWAEDATHDVFVKFLEHLPELDNPDDVGGWLYRVASNLCISRLRREQSFMGWLRNEQSADTEGVAPAVDVLLDERTEAKEALEALRTLPAKERVVLCMKVLDNKSQREIADVLSLSEGYVSKLVARAWARLRKAGWEGGDAEA